MRTLPQVQLGASVGSGDGFLVPHFRQKLESGRNELPQLQLSASIFGSSTFASVFTPHCRQNRESSIMTLPQPQVFISVRAGAGFFRQHFRQKTASGIILLPHAQALCSPQFRQKDESCMSTLPQRQDAFASGLDTKGEERRTTPTEVSTKT